MYEGDNPFMKDTEPSIGKRVRNASAICSNNCKVRLRSVLDPNSQQQFAK